MATSTSDFSCTCCCTSIPAIWRWPVTGCGEFSPNSPGTVMGNDLTLELERLDRERGTGVLRVRDGAFHLAEGAITFAECRHTTGLDRLVAAAEVATATEWGRAAGGDPGPLLARPRLEILASLAVFDAAYFLLAAPAGPEFRPAAAQWLAPLCHIPPAAILREVALRGDPRVAPWPADLVDRAPIVPVRRISRHRVMLTGAQAEVLAAADRRRTVAAIAR